MESDSGGIEVAFPVHAGRIDEFLVFGDTPGRLQVFAKETADGLEIEVNDAVGFGKQAGGFGRGLGTEKDGDRQQDQYTGYHEERSAGSFVH